MTVPQNPRIYHIVHVDRLASIVRDGRLWCDAVATERNVSGTAIGMPDVKSSRLVRFLDSYDDLAVGNCVPFNFCPRSMMLYVIWKANHPQLAYRGGQRAIVHLEADLREAVEWADSVHQRWAFTTANAASHYAEDYSDLRHLDEITWSAVAARDWSACRDEKQAEFLMEYNFPWSLIGRIGIHSRSMYSRVQDAIGASGSKPTVEVKSDWYY